MRRSSTGSPTENNENRHTQKHCNKGTTLSAQKSQPGVIYGVVARAIQRRERPEVWESIGEIIEISDPSRYRRRAMLFSYSRGAALEFQRQLRSDLKSRVLAGCLPPPITLPSWWESY